MQKARFPQENLVAICGGTFADYVADQINQQQFALKEAHCNKAQERRAAARLAAGRQHNQAHDSI